MRYQPRRHAQRRALTSPRRIHSFFTPPGGVLTWNPRVGCYAYGDMQELSSFVIAVGDTPRNSVRDRRSAARIAVALIATPAVAVPAIESIAGRRE